MKKTGQLIAFIAFLMCGFQISAQTMSYRFQKNNILSNLGNSSGHLTVTTTLAVTDGYYILGNIENYSIGGGLENDLFIAHVDERGTISSSNYWVKTYGLNGRKEIGTHLIQGFYGELIVLGEIRDNSQWASEKILVLRLNANGTIINSKEISGISSGNPLACSARGFEIVRLLGPTGPDGFAICGFTQSCVQGGAQNPIVVRLDNSLNQVWFKQYNNLHGKFFSIMQRSGGLGTNLITVGTDWDQVGVMAEIDYVSGALVTNNTSIPGTGGNFFYIQGVNHCSKVINTPDGGFLVGSSMLPSRFGPSKTFMLHKFSASGAPSWGSRYTVGNINSDVQLEDIKFAGSFYHVLFSSYDGLIISSIEMGANHLATNSMLFKTNVAQTSFDRVSPAHGDYQKLHFDFGHILPFLSQQSGGPTIGNGYAIASHFGSAFSTGAAPNVPERKEFRLIKTDFQLNTGNGSQPCGLDVAISKDCSWDASNYLWDSWGCGNISGSTYSFTESNLIFNSSVVTNTISSGYYIHCNEETYIVEQDPIYRLKGGSESTDKSISGLNIEAHPNPAHDFILISGLNKSVALVKIMDVQGKVVLEQQISEKTKHQLTINFLDNGIYLIQVTQDGNIENIKFVKE